MAETALIVGAGAGLSAALAARNTAKLADLAQQTGARTYACDVARLFDAVAGYMGFPDVVVFNPSARVRGPIAELDPAARPPR